MDLGYRDGERRRKTLYGKTRREVTEKLKRAQAEQAAGGIATTERLTVARFLARGSTGVWWPAVAPKTATTYESIVRVRIVPRIGRLLLARNPCDGATPPCPKRRVLAVLTQEQVTTLFAAARHHPMHALYVLAVTTGMRQGELLGLRWSDVNFDGRCLTVARALQRQRAGLTFVTPKTAGSRRTIVLSEAAVHALRQHRTRQRADRLLAGGQWEEHDLVFCGPLGKPLDPSWQTGVFKQVLKAAGLPAIRFHDLRHTAATLLLTKGVHPKVVSELLGHVTITLTLDTYSHLVPALHEQAAAVMDDLVAS